MTEHPAGVDWDLAAATANRLVAPGPEVSRREADAVVAELRDAAARAEAHVRQATGLIVPSGTAPVLVVDRPGWIRANLQAFAQIMAPLGDKLPERSLAGLGPRVSGVEVGVLMSYLAPRVLGQFDPYAEPAGRLLLVAPNVRQVERELRVPSADFRLWVCLHEETHRAQFTGVGWLRDHLRALIDQVVGSTDLSMETFGQVIRSVVDRLAERGEGSRDWSLLDLLQGEGQRAAIERITAIMTLLEGHADHMMDQVGPDVIPTVVQIRAKFTSRRSAPGLQRLVRRLLGLDAKMRQYAEGAAFCRAVIDAAGLDGFNRVWVGPDNLPTLDEIAAPSRWVERVLPGAAVGDGSAGDGSAGRVGASGGPD